MSLLAALTTLLCLLAPLGASAATDGPGALELRTLDPAAQRIYDGVFPNVRRPAIGPIRIAGAGGQLAVEFTVAYPRKVARPDVARVRGVVGVEVARRSRNGGTVGTVQKARRTTRLTPAGARVRYSVALSPKASRWLRSHWKQRADLVPVNAAMQVDVDGDGSDDHYRGAAATVRYSRAGASASAADNTIVLELLNGTGVKMNNLSMPVQCMYENGKEGSNIQFFNLVQGGTLEPGGSIVTRIAADGDFFDSPEFMSNPAEDSVLIQWLRLAGDTALEFVKNVPLLGLIVEADNVANNCENNASVFSFTAAEAKQCPGKEGCNRSTTGAWVMSLREETDRIAPPIDSAVAATYYQWYGNVDAISPWGVNWLCPICDGVLGNPTSQALYPLAQRWLTYMGGNGPSKPPCEAGFGQMVGDRGLSWLLIGDRSADVYVLQPYKSGLETGWSGSNSESPLQGNPSWSQKYPTSYCPT